MQIDLDKHIEHLFMALFVHKNCIVLDLLDTIQAEHFESSECGFSFNILRDHFNRYGSMPSTKVFLLECKNKHMSQEFLETIVESVKFIENEKLEFFEEKARAHFDYKITEKAIFNAAEMIESGRKDEIADMIRKAVHTVDKFDIGTQYFLDLDKRYQLVHKCYPTGFSKLDSYIGGGFRRKCLYAISGATGGNKSLVLYNFGIKQALAGKKVVIFSLELSEEMITDRLDCFVLNEKFDISKIEKLRDKLAAIQQKLGTENNLVIKRMPEVLTTTNSLRGYIDQLKKRKDFVPDMIILDYIDLLSPVNKDGLKSTHEMQGRATAEFRAWMEMEDTIGLTACQLNREGAKNIEGADETNVSESFKKVMYLDFLMSLVQTKADKALLQPRIFFKMDKNRFGPTGKKVLLTINYDAMKVTQEIAQPSS